MTKKLDEQSLFDALLETAATARESALGHIALRDAALAERLRALLQAHEQPLLEAAPAVEIPDTAPQAIGPYRVLERLGRGGMGNVYLCEQSQPVRRNVAVKVLRAGMDTRDVIARFDAERQALALMTHANIARILDAGATTEGRPYFVMEFVPGTPLLHYCRDRTLTVKQRLALFMQVCAAVQHAHQKGVIHRDLKPSNILVMEIDGVATPKIIDFGIAKATAVQLTGKTLHTLHGNLVGTPEYMSPEQADIGAIDIDTRSDIYSLGVVLYELLTGTVPFCFSTQVISLNSIQRILRTEDAPVPSARLLADPAAATHAAACGLPRAAALAETLRGDLDWITLKALEKDRARRYPSAAEFAADIARHLADEPVAAARPGSLYVLGKFVRRHAVATAGSVLLTVMLIAFSTYANFQAGELEAERDRATYNAAKARQVTEFLMNLFAVGDPQSGYSRDLTIREAVDIGARRTRIELRHQPEVRAALLHAIGRVYNQLGLYSEAENILLEMLSGTSPDMRVQRDATVELARARIAQDKFEAAETDLLALIATLPSTIDRTRLEAQVLLGRLHLERGRLDEAAAIFRGVSEQAIVHPGEFDDLHGIALLGLGNVLIESGDIDAAAAPLDEAHALIARSRGENSAIGIEARNALAYQLTMQGRYQEALPYYRKSLEMALRIFGEAHHSTAVAYNDLGMIQSYLDDYESAEAAFTRALEIHTQVHGDMHSETLRAMSNLAGVYGVSGRQIAKAAVLFEKAIAARTTLFGANSDEVARTMMNYGFALNVAGEFEKAEHMFRRSARSYEGRYGRNHWLFRNAQNGLGEALTGQGRFAAAKIELCDSHRSLAAMFGGDHPRAERARELIDALHAAWRAAEPAHATEPCE